MPFYVKLKQFACNVRDLGSIPRLGRSPAEGNGNPLQYSCLENSMDRRAYQGVTKNQTRLSNFHFHYYIRSPFHLTFQHTQAGGESLEVGGLSEMMFSKPSPSLTLISLCRVKFFLGDTVEFMVNVKAHLITR